MTVPTPEPGATPAGLIGGDADLNALAAKYGIPASALQGGGGGVSSNLSSVNDGTALLYLAPQPTPGGPAAFRMAEQGVPLPAQKSINDATLDFYGWDAKQLADFQSRAHAAGLIKTVTGDYDENSLAAWKAVLTRAAAFQMKGKQFTPDDVLSMMVHSAAAQGSGNRTVIQLTSGASLEQTLQANAKALLGRELSKRDLSKFTTLIHGLQSATQTAAQDPNFAGQITGVDPSAEAQQYVTQNFGQEAANFGTAHVGRLMLQLMGGGQ